MAVSLLVCFEISVIPVIAQAGAVDAGLGTEPVKLRQIEVAAPVRSDVPRKSEAIVSYQAGQLKIDAEGATLAAVLELVAAKTGAIIDVPPGSGLERIVEHLGSGEPKDVLNQLLNGSHFNFVIVSSPQHPNPPERVLLSVQTKDIDNALPPKAAVAAASPLPVLLPQIEDGTLTPPDGPLTPEARGELMKEKARELREKAQQQ
jgi:hypothetical protein